MTNDTVNVQLTRFRVWSRSLELENLCRRSSDWLPDPLLQCIGRAVFFFKKSHFGSGKFCLHRYGLLPTVVSQMETAVGHGAELRLRGTWRRTTHETAAAKV